MAVFKCRCVGVRACACVCVEMDVERAAVRGRAMSCQTVTRLCPWDSETMRAKTKPADTGGWNQPRENTFLSLFLAPLSLPPKIKLVF